MRNIGIENYILKVSFSSYGDEENNYIFLEDYNSFSLEHWDFGTNHIHFEKFDTPSNLKRLISELIHEGYNLFDSVQVTINYDLIKRQRENFIDLISKKTVNISEEIERYDYWINDWIGSINDCIDEFSNVIMINEDNRFSNIS